MSYFLCVCVCVCIPDRQSELTKVSHNCEATILPPPNNCCFAQMKRRVFFCVINRRMLFFELKMYLFIMKFELSTAFKHNASHIYINIIHVLIITIIETPLYFKKFNICTTRYTCITQTYLLYSTYKTFIRVPARAYTHTQSHVCTSDGKCALMHSQCFFYVRLIH